MTGDVGQKLCTSPERVQETAETYAGLSSAGLRERAARLVDPEAWDDEDWRISNKLGPRSGLLTKRLDRSLAKADAVIAMLAAAPETPTNRKTVFDGSPDHIADASKKVPPTHTGGEGS